MMLSFRGKAETPTYLFIHDRKAELLDAKEIWGLDTTETENYLKNIHGDSCKIACIGPAGENLSLISAIIHDGRAAARSGVGAVMGSKKIKAVVTKGSMRSPLADPERTEALRRKYIKMPSREYKPLSETGTIGILGTSIMSGDAPVKNWKGSGLKDFPHGIEKFAVDRVMKYQTKRKGCWHCNCLQWRDEGRKRALQNDRKEG